MNVQHSIGRPVRCVISTIGVMSATSVRAVGANLHAIVADGPRERFDILRHLRSGPGQSDICRVDAERIHVPENLDPFIDRWRANRRRLQTIPKRLVVQQRLWMTRTDRVVVPVVNQWMRRRGHRHHLRFADRFRVVARKVFGREANAEKARQQNRARCSRSQP